MTRIVKIAMPRLGESVAEGTLAKWLVEPGARVKALDVIAEIDTDKVSAEIPTPVTGVVQSLLAREGETVLVGAEIAAIETEDQVTAQPAKVEAPSVATADVAAPPETHRYSPAVRELARQKDIDPSTIAGSGSHGRVTRADVERSIGQAGPAVEGDQVLPLSRVRRLIAEAMALSKRTIPHAWQSQEVDMSGVVASRNAHKESFQQQEGFPLTFVPYVLAAAASALTKHHSMNSTFENDHLVLHGSINVGVAIGLEEGVLVPVIRNADRLSIAGLARAMNDLSVRARSKKLTADDLTGGTFTVNNSGTFGTVISYSVINPGQAGILTMGAIRERVVAIEGRIAIKPMMFLSLSLDHRVLDGLEAARFLSSCRESLEAVTKDTSPF